jgi:formylglycine-generating enzyme required for sulfatase activity
VNGFRLARSLPKSIELVEIPAQENTPLGYPASSPEVMVSLPKYRIAKDETTFAKWSAVVKGAKETFGWTLATGIQGSGGSTLTGQHPVTSVTFQEVAVWCNAASKLEGLDPVYSTFDAVGNKVLLTPDTQNFVNDRGIHWEKTANGYRLPTGDEWEVAARGGLKGRTYPWGDEGPSPKNTNWVYADGYPNATTPVGSYPRNAYGLSDCAGNAFEMTWDTSLAPGSAVPDVIKGNAIVRGGAWNQGYLPKISGYGWDLPISWDKRTEYGFRIAQNASFSKYLSSGFSLISGGSFQMGGSDLDSDLPQVAAVYVKSFYAAHTEVTFGDWTQVRAWAERNGYTFSANVSGKASDHPVLRATWYDAVKWCNALSEMEGRMPVYYAGTGRLSSNVYRSGADRYLQESDLAMEANGYRLPTQAEWEKAARGGLEGKRFPWGDTISPAQANYSAAKDKDYDLSTLFGVADEFKQGGLPYTNAVKRFAPNGYGLYGMAGNMNEWCWDPQYEPNGANGGYNKYFIRAARGGSVEMSAKESRVAFVDFKYGDLAHGGGFPSFRLVLNAP